MRMARQRNSRLCSVDGCGRPHNSHGWCVTHGGRVARNGTAAADVLVGALPPKSGWTWKDHDYVGPYVAIRRNGRSDRQHRAVAEHVLGRRLPPHACVHHIDDDGRNNQPRNLVICQNLAFHKLLHYRRRILQAYGDPNADYWCSRCGPARRELFTFRRNGRPVSYCRPCAARVMAAWRRGDQEELTGASKGRF